MHQTATTNELRTILVFSALYLIASAVCAFGTGNGEFVFYIVVMAVQLAALLFVHSRVGLSKALIWALSIWGLLHMAGGLLPIPSSWNRGEGGSVLYNLWLIPERLKYDQIIHAYGFGITSWLCWQALGKAILGATGKVVRASAGLMILCAAAGMGFGALNEVVEFFATLSLPETNVGGYENTGWDLVSNLVGSTIAVLLIYFRARVGAATPQHPADQ
ncbi:MAG: hypothetical protein P1U58_07915 [Verrucomicrobiales bacterium]|nr:hypothetical protein [Verrucomicrobiales bacterium]